MLSFRRRKIHRKISEGDHLYEGREDMVRRESVATYRQAVTADYGTMTQPETGPRDVLVGEH
jgi:hypothetical protein